MELTQQEVADRVGITLSYYQKIEYGYISGTRWPSPDMIKRLAKAMKCKQTDFFKEL